MTAGEHELPPHLARYLAVLSEPAAATGDAPRLTVAAGYDVGQYLPPARTETVPATPAAEASQEAVHVDPAAAARWHQAQAEMAALIRAENRLGTGHPGPGRAALLPASLADWMENRVAELGQAEASQPEIG
jgi:hypothetical protein